MNSVLQTLLISFIGYSILNTGQVLQKLGMDLLPRKRRVGVITLIIANLTTISSTFVVLVAISLGDVSLVGAMAGSGLVTMVLASHLILKEPLEARILGSIGIIIAGIFLLGYFAGAPTSRYNPYYLLTFSILVTVALLLGIFLSRNSSFYGPSLGAFSGAWAGLVTLLQKSADLYTGPRFLPLWLTDGIVHLTSLVGIPETFSTEAVRVLLNPYVPLWVAISTSSMFLIHFAFSRGRAVHIIPIYSALFILIPVIGGRIAFRESLGLVQWTGVGVILAGSILINIQRSAREPLEQNH